jgi:hypothetical protein
VAIDIFEGLVGSFHWLAQDLMVYRYALKDTVFTFFVRREFLFGVLGVAFWAFCLALVLISWQWLVIFGLAAIGSFFSVLAQRNYAKH